MGDFRVYARSLCTVRGRLDAVKLDALNELPRDTKRRLMALHDGAHDFELWQSGEGLWQCRVKIGVNYTHVARSDMRDAILDCLATPGAEVPR